jgi:hypothetical protein
MKTIRKLALLHYVYLTLICTLQADYAPLYSAFWHFPARRWHYRVMKPLKRAALLWAILLSLGAMRAYAGQLKVSRAALQRTLENQLFNGPSGRYYLKGSPVTPCSIYVDNPQMTFAGDRIQVQVKTHARLGTAVRGACLGIGLSPSSVVSVAPSWEGETIGFRDARVERVSDQKELNFLLMPFLSHQIPDSMTVNAADLLRKALEGSTGSSGYKVTLDHLKIHSVQIQGDNLIFDVDGDVSVR